MALIDKTQAIHDQTPTGEQSLHAQDLSQYVQSHIASLSRASLSSMWSSGDSNPNELQITAYPYPDVQPVSTASTGPSELHGLQYRAPEPETPPLTAKELGQELTAAMESHDPNSMNKFENDLYKAVGNESEIGTELLVDQINANMPKGMGIELTDDEAPGAADDFHHYSLHFLQQVNSGGNFQSAEYGPCEEEAPPMMLSTTPDWMKRESVFHSAPPKYEVID